LLWKRCDIVVVVEEVYLRGSQSFVVG